MILHAICPITVCFLLLSCAGTRPPKSLVELERLADGQVSKQVMEHAPGAWGEGIHYLSLARDAANSRDSLQADRFARLGTLYIRIALAAHRQATYQDRLEVALQEKHAFLLKEERLRSRIAHLEATNQRRAMRAHLARVLDETLLETAAKETLTAHHPNDNKRMNRGVAQLRVGQEMIARAEIREGVLQVYVAAGMLHKEKAVPVAREIEHARKELQTLDMIAVQKHLESAGIAANRLLADIWIKGEETRAERIEITSAKLAEGGFYVVREAFGPAVSFVLSGPKPTKNWAGQVKKLGRMLAEMDNVHLVVLASSGASGRSKKTLKKSLKRANATAELLAKAGLESGRLHAFGVGGTSPLESLREGRERVAVLIVPTVPE